MRGPTEIFLSFRFVHRFEPNYSSVSQLLVILDDQDVEYQCTEIVIHLLVLNLKIQI